MIQTPDFCQSLLKAGYDYFTGVPCSFFKGVINYTQENQSMPYIMASNEGAAVALAAGAYLSGRQPVVMIQNSGLGNMINPLTSLSQIYKIPTLLLISGRAYQVDDEPQHEIIGATMKELLGVLGIPTYEAPQELQAFQNHLKTATQMMLDEKTPVAFIVKKGTISNYDLKEKPQELYPLTRYQAIEVLMQHKAKEALVISTTGKPSRELFAIQDRPQNLYLMGSMGHAMAVGCAVAMEKPSQKVYVLDGDGAVIMHMGSLSTIGFYKPQNLVHVVLDNEAYETTGNQDTTAKTTNFAKIAQHCGYAQVFRCEDEASFQASLNQSQSLAGPILIHVKINRRPTSEIPRITTQHSAPEIAENFRNAVQSSSKV